MAQDVAAAQLAYVQETAADLDGYNQAVVPLNKTLKDQEVNRQKALQDAVDAAEWVYVAAMHQANYDLTVEDIEPEDYDAIMDAAQTTKDTSVADAEVTRANSLAVARQSWTQGVGAKKVDLTADLGAAYLGLVSDLTTAGVDYVSQRAEATKTRVQALAAAERFPGDENARRDKT